MEWPTKPDDDPFHLFGDRPFGLQRAWLYLNERQAYFSDFLSCCVALVNSYPPKAKVEKSTLKNALLDALKNCQILYEIFSDEDGTFIFPKGAKELDEVLISQPLEWLSTYPKSHSAFVNSLKEYGGTTSEKASDIADKFRKALETFFQEYFGGRKSLENYKGEYGKYLKDQGIPKEISGNFETLLQSYTQFMNNYAKHRNATSDKVLEYIMYQTGNIIRLLITLRQEE